MVFVVIDTNGQAYLMGDKDVAAIRDKGDLCYSQDPLAPTCEAPDWKFIYPVNNPRVYVGETDGLLTAAL